MTERLYLDDAYLRKCSARVERVDSRPDPSPDGAGLQRNRLVLDRTVLYAESGGQAADHGWIRWNGHEARITDVQIAGGGHVGDLEHTVEGPVPEPGDEVEVEVDWARRYALMRHHTAAHVFAAVLHREYGALFTGGQLGVEESRFDAEFEDWRPEIKEELEEKVNAEIGKNYRVENRTISRKEFDERAEELLRTKENLLDPAISEIRLTDIVGLDCQADGGTHVRETKEVGRVVLGKTKNKGKGHRRIYYALEP